MENIDNVWREPEATFRAPQKFTKIYIRYPEYVHPLNDGIELEENKRGTHCAGSGLSEYVFSGGTDCNELTVYGYEEIQRVREYIKHREGFIEVSNNEEDIINSNCKPEQKEEKEGLSDWDKKMISRLR